MTTRPPPFVPPPAPLSPPPVPAPPPGVPPLTVPEKGAHLVGFLVGWCGLGLVVTGAAGAWALDLPGLALGVLLVGVPPAGVAVVWALLPLWGEWRQRRAGHAWAQDSLYHWRAHYAEAFTDAAAYRAKWYGVRPDAPPEDEEIIINGQRMPRHPTVTRVSTPEPDPPAAEEPEPEPPTATEIIHRARAAAATFLGRMAPAPRERTTERLPAGERARVVPPPRAARVPYTPAMRAIIDTYLATGKTSQRACADRGLSRPAWEAANDVLIAEGVLLPGRNKTYLLAPGLQVPGDGAATHRRIAQWLSVWA